MDNKGFITGIQKKDGWSAGRQMTSGNKSQIVSLQADFLQKPGIYTAQFTITPLEPVPPPPVIGFFAPIRAEATVFWAVEGNTVTRKLSVTNGASISGPGQAVRIVIADVTVGGVPSAQLGQPYFCAVTLVPGLRPTDGIPPLLNNDNATFLPAPSSAPFNVPQNVGVKSLLVTVGTPSGAPLPEQQIQVYQYSAGGNLLALYDPRAYEFYPLMPGCVSILVQNNSLTEVVVCSVTWGIDG
jgi:hypothetical protein